MFSLILIVALAVWQPPLYPDQLGDLREASDTTRLDTLSLPEVRITADRFELDADRLPTAIRQLTIDSLPTAPGISAGDIAGRFSMISVRSYGPSLAQTVSLQGFSGSQLAVLWEDVLLNNPMLGLADLSLYPAVMIDRVEVNPHQGSAEFGAHAIGGIIQLRQLRSDENRVRILAQGNTMQSTSVQGRVQQHIGRWYLDAGGSYQSSPNRFEYDDILANPVRTARRENARRTLQSGVARLSYTGQTITNDARIWVSRVESGIPGSIVSPSPNAEQRDAMIRVSNQLTYSVSKPVTLTISGQYNRHRLDYIDPDVRIESLSTAQSLSSRVALRYRFPMGEQLRLQTGIGRSWVDFTEYEPDFRIHGFVQANGYAQWADTHIHPSFRLDVFSEFGSALTGSLGFSRSLKPQGVRVFGSIHRNFSPPTFNDLYWPELGNPDLTPEHSVKTSLGAEANLLFTDVMLQLFGNTIQNGIQWLPSSGDGRFRPQNIRSVRTAGVSLGTRTSWSSGNIRHALSTDITYLDARYTAERFSGDASFGKQLVYQPHIRGMLSLNTRWESIWFFADVHHTGARAVTEDHAFSLPAHQLVDIGLGVHTLMLGTQTQFLVSVENFGDTAYQLIRFYPMPGRHFNISISITL